MWNDIGQSNTNFTRGFVVEYDLHPNAITLNVAIKDSDEVRLSWESRVGVSYTIEWVEDFGDEWTLLTTVVGNGGTTIVDDSLTSGRRFYRCSAPQ